MPIHQLSKDQIVWIVEQVADYIEQQRRTYRSRAVALDGHERSAMHPFFPASILDTARVVVLAGERVANPSLYRELVKMGFGTELLPDFATMGAITFVDTVASHGPYNNRTLFHELVHVVQYEKLGLAGFAAKYVNGFLGGGSYDAIPLEMNAYELEARFAAEPTKPFSVEAEVRAWIDADKF